MDTDGGGWTLVYSYGFIDYQNYDENSNAVAPIPSWDAGLANVRTQYKDKGLEMNFPCGKLLR